MNPRIIVAITGASGAIYGAVLVAELLQRPIEVHLIISDYGHKVMAHELGISGPILPFLQSEFGLVPHEFSVLKEYLPDNLFAPPASGSFRHSGMVIAPCSMKTLAAIAAGLADNLIVRSADVCLKEKRPLILLPRETPLSTIHLENMLKVARAGAVLHPPVPAFYHRPESVRDIVNATVGRVLDHLGISHHLAAEWNGT
ncbi:MAG: UbiX family flavin prenyltransferase [Deltaproteobacteria bacterium]|nr:UbiX family flavin prenyltransferase [Deltaproteobacteria bacterium]